MKRFYKLVSVSNLDNGYGIALDNKPVKTPGGKVLCCNNTTLANEMMREWSAQDKDIVPSSMPANQMVMTSLDQIHSREELERHILSYVDSDLTLYRSTTTPYKERQDLVWGRWTKWFEVRFSAPLKITYDLQTIEQDPIVSSSVADYIASLDHLRLVVFDTLIEDTSSPILTLAFFEGAATPEDIYQAALVDDLIRADIYQEDKYGAAPDQEKKRASIQKNLEAALKILSA